MIIWDTRTIAEYVVVEIVLDMSFGNLTLTNSWIHLLTFPVWDSTTLCIYILDCDVMSISNHPKEFKRISNNYEFVCNILISNALHNCSHSMNEWGQINDDYYIFIIMIIMINYNNDDNNHNDNNPKNRMYATMHLLTEVKCAAISR